MSEFYWIKIYDINHKLFWQVCVSIWKFKFQKWQFYDHLFGNYTIIFHKTGIWMVILRCLVCKNLNSIKSCNIILIKSFFHGWKCFNYGLVCRSEFWHIRRKSALVFSKWILFQNPLGFHETHNQAKYRWKNKTVYWTFH